MMSIPPMGPPDGDWPGAGHEESLARVKGEDLLMIMDARNLRPTDAQRDRVMACSDLGLLDLWFDRALTADSAEEVFR